ncbi:MAG TPA: DNA polymerase Y family protein [Chthoniobacteraceae bacterium]|nr:DNA polymerase Y family protein [Chthoniobacteraceae bacterium]
MLFCTLQLPQFHLQAALRHRPEAWRKPLAVVDETTSRLVGLTPLAAEAGVEIGMSPAQGAARTPRLEILPRAVDTEASLSRIVLEIAGTLSAYLEATAPDLCTLDLQGLTLGDPEAWAKNLLPRFEAVQLRIRAGVAQTPDLSLLAVHSTTPREPVCVVRHSRAFLAPLPLTAVACPETIRTVLHDWGITTLGGLTRLDKDEIATRLGPEALRLWEQAAGCSRRVLRLVRPVERFEETFDFDYEPDTAQPLLFLLRRFVDQLTARLEGVGLVAEALLLTLPLCDGSAYQRRFSIPSPTANPEVLFRILDTHFESLRLELAPVGLRLQAFPTRPHAQQERLFEKALRDPHRFAETVARLMALAGNENVGTPRLLPTHQPDASVLEPPRFGEPPPAPPPPQEEEEPVGLPLRRFRPPLPAKVELREARPGHLACQAVRGTIVDTLGPYRLSGQWWEEGWSTEEWDVELEGGGGLYRLSRSGGQWQVEGCYER